ncbi:MAG: DegV family protein [Chloroflexota bacterium]
MTGQVHILTDSTAQFLEPKFKGCQLVTMLPPEPTILSTHQGAVRPGRVNPHHSDSHSPATEAFERGFTSLYQATRDVLVLTSTQALSRAFEGAGQAAARMNGGLDIRVVDSHTTSAGLGWLVQAAARLAQEGMRLNELERHIRLAAANVYTLLCIPDLAYLARTGYLEAEQARVGEMMGLLPIFSIEDSRLTPLSKVRTQRHLFEAFQEFVGEFETPRRVFYLRAAGSNSQPRTRALREFVSQSFPEIELTELPMSPSLAARIGPQSSGIVVVEKPERLA